MFVRNKCIIRKGKCGQVWWPILRICALHLTLCTHTAVSSEQTRTHTPRAVGIRAVGSHFYPNAQGAVGGLVPCSRVSPQLWYWGWRERWTFTPLLTIPARPETRTRNLWVTSPTLYPLGHDCPIKAFLTPNCCFRLKYESIIHNIAFSSANVIPSQSWEKYAQIKHNL